VDTAPAQTGPIAAGLSFTGDVTASRQVNLVPKVSGLVVKLMADVGDHVTAGQQVAELDHVTQDAAVRQAEAAVEVAKANQAKAQAQGRPEEVARTQAALAAAKAKLDLMQQQGRSESVAAAQANLDTANAKLQALQSGTDANTLANDKAALEAAQAKLAVFQSRAQQDAFQKAVEVARNNLLSSQITRDASCRTAGGTCDAANATVNAQQSALNSALDTLAINQDPNTLLQLQDAVNQAQTKVNTDLATAPTDLQQAQAAVAQAQAQLALAKTPNTAQDLTQQQAAVDQATQLAREAATPNTQYDLQASQANVDAAVANLEVQKVNQQLTQVTAPFDGVISAKLLSEGALASTTVPVFTIVSSDVEIDLPVAQDQISSIKEGQPAQLTSPAVSGPINGKIATISPAADPKSRTFLVRVVPSAQDGTLKPGMSVGVRIQTSEKPNALLIPKDAVTTDNSGKQGVYVVQEGQNGQVATFKPVTFGASDDKNVEVVSGLNPGDVVVVTGQTSLSNNQRVRPAGQGGQGGQAGGNASGRPQGSQGNASARPSAQASGGASS